MDDKNNGMIPEVKAVDLGHIHKKNRENAFVSEIGKIGENSFQTKIYFPKNHFLFNDQLMSGLAGSSFFLEATKQFGTAVCHLFYGHPLWSQFVIKETELEFTDSRPFVAARDYFEIRLEITAEMLTQGLGRKKSLFQFYQGGTDPFLRIYYEVIIAEKKLDMDLAADKGEDSKLSAIGGSLIAPREVQLSKPESVFISEVKLDENSRKASSAVVVNLNHRLFFEHSLNHVPGDLLFEAGRQLTINSLKKAFGFLGEQYGDFQKARIKFMKFAELAFPVALEIEWLEAERIGETTLLPVALTYWQNGKKIAVIKDAKFAFAAVKDAR